MNENANPFDESTFVHGGGIWDQKVVTITAAKTVDDPIADGNNQPLIDSRTGQQSHFRGLVITGIAEDAEYERREQYSAGSLLPTPDGEGFLPQAEGKPVRFHESSAIAEFARSLKASGFDVSKLFVEGKLRFSALVGARFVMRGEQKKDRDGKLKFNKKGYADFRFFPDKYLGQKEGVVGPAPVSNALRDKAVNAVVAVLKENGGSLGRAELVRKISGAMATDEDKNKVLALIGRDEFHKDAPWVRDGTSYRLS